MAQVTSLSTRRQTFRGIGNLRWEKHQNGRERPRVVRLVAAQRFVGVAPVLVTPAAWSVLPRALFLNKQFAGQKIFVGSERSNPGEKLARIEGRLQSPSPRRPTTNRAFVIYAAILALPSSKATSSLTDHAWSAMPASIAGGTCKVWCLQQKV